MKLILRRTTFRTIKRPESDPKVFLNVLGTLSGRFRIAFEVPETSTEVRDFTEKYDGWGL